MLEAALVLEVVLGKVRRGSDHCRYAGVQRRTGFFQESRAIVKGAYAAVSGVAPPVPELPAAAAELEAKGFKNVESSGLLNVGISHGIILYAGSCKLGCTPLCRTPTCLWRLIFCTL
jgi:hypothetical protein